MKKKIFTLLLALVAIATTAQAQNTINGHEYVDLGLPSGLLWATCNVGAEKPEDYGLYFAWGETVGYTDDTSDGRLFDWANYKWCDGSEDTLTKYCNNSEKGKDGFTDDKTVLDAEDDAATANWGEGWRMPTKDEIKELFDNTTNEWTELNGVKGRKFTSNTNGNSIFLPASGSRGGGSLYYVGSYGVYWSSSLYESFPALAYYLSFSSVNAVWYYDNLQVGQSVRPVAVKVQTTGLLLNAANFPDANFRAALASKLGISESDEITAEKIAATTQLVVAGKQIADLTGIEHFTALTELWCGDNQLTSLDVSKNTALTWLGCSNNQLTLLDVSNNAMLKTLYCGNNPLTSLNVSKNTVLTKLDYSYTQLTSFDLSKHTALEYLSCSGNQLTSLDLSSHTALTTLYCYDNQLTTLDVSQNTALTELYCGGNQLNVLDLSKNTSLTHLICAGNKLSSLDFSQNKSLSYVQCCDNRLKGKAMDALVESLPMVESGTIMVVDIFNANGENVCTKSQVAVAKEKGWKVTRQNEGCSKDYVILYLGVEYEGSDDPEQEIDPVDEYDNIDYGSDMDENSNLDGNVIGDIFYNISSGNGEYNSEEGCIVVTKPTDDGTVDELEGKDIFGEDVKNNFTGIIFKVPAGKGTIKVNAETTGNMLLKVKIGSNDPVEMELVGKLKISFPYNVMEETFVYIYAGAAANEAKGFGKTSSTDAALKIYGIEFLRDDATSIDEPTPDNSLNEGENWYTIDGVKLSGEPTMKGVYVVNGRKVVK